VYVQFQADSRVCRRYDDGFAIGNEADVTNESLVENFVNNRVIVLAALRETLQSGSIGWRERGQF
jgi:hypothetical protein